MTSNPFLEGLMKINFETILVSVTAIAVIVFQSLPLASVFAVSCLVLAFTRFLERKRLDSTALINDEIQKIKHRLEAIELRKAMGR